MREEHLGVYRVGCHHPLLERAGVRMEWGGFARAAPLEAVAVAAAVAVAVTVPDAVAVAGTGAENRTPLVSP